jgi:hypothetical protein
VNGRSSGPARGVEIVLDAQKRAIAMAVGTFHRRYDTALRVLVNGLLRLGL